MIPPASTNRATAPSSGAAASAAADAERLPPAQDEAPVDGLYPPRRSPAPDEWGASSFVPYDQRWSGGEDGPMPAERGVPQLAQIVPELWATAVIGLPERLRRRLISGAGLSYGPEVGDVIALLGALPPAPDVLVRRVEQAGGMGVPVASPDAAGRRRSRQVNVRLSREEFGELAAAANIAGTCPTTLARMLMLGGLRKILAEHGRYYSALAED